MPHVIAEPCLDVKDAACVAVCPMNGIHPTPEEAEFQTERMLYINAAACIDCGVCIDECSRNAIFAIDELPEKWSQYIEVNAQYYRRRLQA